MMKVQESAFLNSPWVALAFSPALTLEAQSWVHLIGFAVSQEMHPNPAGQWLWQQLVHHAHLRPAPLKLKFRKKKGIRGDAQPRLQLRHLLQFLEERKLVA